MFKLNIYELKWILYIKNSLIDCGFPCVWNAQHIPNSFACFKEVIKTFRRSIYTEMVGRII